MADIRHDVRVRMFLAGKWEDVTGYTLSRKTITITRGRKDENTKTPPCTASLSLKNNDGRFSLRNPMGPWYDSLGQNNPIEITKRLAAWAPAHTLTNSWGSTDRSPGVPSYSWAALDNPNDFDVTVSGATIVVPSAGNIRRISLSGFTQADASATVEYSLTVSNVTGDFIVAPGPSLRGNYYARVEISTSEALTLGIRDFAGDTFAAQVATGLTHVAGTKYTVRLVADGTTLAAKVWVSANGEPRDWMVTASVQAAKATGTAGVRAACGPSNTNVPFTATVHAFTVESMRFSGEVSKFPATSQANGKDQFVTIEAAGILRRLGQGRSPTLSALRRGVLSLNPVAYWPCEEGPDATGLSSAIEGVPPMGIVEHGSGPPDFAAFDGFACSLPIPIMNDTGWFGAIPDYDSSAGKMQMRALVHVPAGGVPTDELLFRINMLGGTTAAWILFLEPDGQLRVDAYGPTGVPVMSGGSISFGVNGKSLRVSLDMEQVGGNIHWTVSTLDPFGVGLFFGADLIGQTIGKATTIAVGASGTLAMGHITFENQITSIFTILPELQAYTGERAGDRMARLSTENSTPFVYYGTKSTSMPLGPQRVDTYLNLIRNSTNAAADADMGTVHERRSFVALAYRDRRSSYAQVSALTLNLSARHIVAPFQPVDDDQGTRNDITLRRTDGGELRRVLETGRKSVQLPPDGVGPYDDAPEHNLRTDAQIPDSLGFLLARGTVDESRFTTLRVNMDAPEVISSGLTSALLDFDVDDRVTITGASSVFVFDDVNQLMRGYTEVLGNHEHRFEFNLSPSAPYDTGTIDGGTYRIGSDTSTISGSELSETGMSFSVATTNADNLFTTNGALFPMDVMVGGERITLSGISGAASPQTFTVSARSVNGVRKRHAVGTKVNVFFPWRLGL